MMEVNEKETALQDQLNEDNGFINWIKSLDDRIKILEESNKRLTDTQKVFESIRDSLKLRSIEGVVTMEGTKKETAHEEQLDVRGIVLL